MGDKRMVQLNDLLNVVLELGTRRGKFIRAGYPDTEISIPVGTRFVLQWSSTKVEFREDGMLHFLDRPSESPMSLEEADHGIVYRVVRVPSTQSVA